MKYVKCILFLIVVLGVGARLFYSTHHGLSNDESFFLLRSMNYLNYLPISTIDQMPVYFMLVDLGYKAFGVLPWVGRLWLSVFTAVLLLTLFWIGKKWTTSEGGLLAALIGAASPFLLLSEQDADLIAVTLCLVASAITYTSSSLRKKALISGAVMGIAILVKVISMFFIPLLIYQLWDRKSRKELLVFFAIIGIIVFPLMLHNVLWYQEDNKVDIPLSGLLGIKTHESLNVAMAHFEVKPLRFFHPLLLYLRSDGLLFMLGALGILGLSSKHQKSLLLWLLALFLIPLFSTHPKHFVFLPLVSALAASGIIYVFPLRKNAILSGCTLIAIVLFVFFVPRYLEGYASLTMMNTLAQYRDEFVIIDARIYPALMPLVVDPLKHVSTSSILDYLTTEDRPPSQIEEKKVVVVSCDSGVCARSKDDFTSGQWDSLNTTIKKIVGASPPLLMIQGGEERYALYVVNAKLPAYVLHPVVDTFYGYPVGWVHPEYAIDYYPVPNGMLKLLYMFAQAGLLLCLILLISIPIIIMYEVLIKRIPL